MEIIELPGYTQDEKLAIATRYLVARQRKANGLTDAQASISEAALRTVIDGYTREAGVRNLEREIGALLRRAAMQIAEGTAHERRDRRGRRARRSWGARHFDNEVKLRTSVPGVATGLAWTPVGGDILFIEATLVPGKGQLILTGQLGDVMKESAQAAVSLAKMRLDALGAARSVLENERPAHPPAGGRDPEGRPERRCRDVPRRRVAAVGPHGAQRHRDDGRDQPARPRAADRRRQGEDAGRAARRHRHRAACRSATRRISRRSPSRRASS